MSFLLKILQIERGPPLQLTIVHVRWNESFKFWFLTGFLYHYSYNTTCHSPNFNVACIIIYPNYYVPPSSTHLSQRVQINPLEHLSVKWLGSVSVGKNAEQTLCSLECSLYRSSRASGLCSIFLIEYLSRWIAFNFQLNCLQK